SLISFAAQATWHPRRTRPSKMLSMCPPFCGWHHRYLSSRSSQHFPHGQCRDDLVHVLRRQQGPADPGVRPLVGQIDNTQGASSILTGDEPDLEIHTSLQSFHGAVEPLDRRCGLHLQQVGFHSGLQYMAIARGQWQSKLASGGAQAPWRLDSPPSRMWLNSRKSGSSLAIAVSGNSTRRTAQRRDVQRDTTSGVLGWVA